MSKAKTGNPLRHLRAADLRGVAQLATQATVGATRIAEGVHQAVWSTLRVPGRQPGRTGGLTGLVYRTVQGVAELTGKGLDRLFAKLQPLLETLYAQPPETPEREALLAALNGVLGDRLAASRNPLATPMTLRYRGQALDWNRMPAPSEVSAKVLLLVHGLCMNDLQWQSRYQDQPVNHGDVLARELGCTPLYLRYNSGLHTSQNGRELSRQLEQLIGHWPTPVQELTVLAHSMGGLLIRSACHYGMEESLRWPRYLKRIVFLGTPHHGAPLERAGNWIDVMLGGTPYSRPFARLAQLRSAGITDLRYGHLLDADWQGHDRFRRQPDRRQALPLPANVACYALAATLAGRRSLLAERLTGDGLVPLRSALGQHDEAQRCLGFAKVSQAIAYRTNHMQLLCKPEVTRQLLSWLTPKPDAGVGLFQRG